jgi:hypothetical protein
MMDPEAKTLWLTDLRSGRFLQGEGGLANRDALGDKRYCCLGVFCERARAEGIVQVDIRLNGKRFYGTEDNGWQPFYLPQEVQEWAELSSDNPVVRYDGQFATLASLNDRGIPFDVIADLIEDQL